MGGEEDWIARRGKIVVKYLAAKGCSTLGNAVRLFTVDLDGCLMPGRDSELDFTSFTMVREYCRRAETLGFPRLVLCTGRPQPYVAAVLRILGAIWPRTPSVIESGAYLYYPYEGEVQVNPLLEGPALERWRELRRDLARQAPEMRARPGLGEKTGLSLFPTDDETVEQLHIRLGDQLIDEGLEFTRSNMCVDITPKGVNKQSGILMLAEATGISAQEMVGIGDSLNDIAMLTAVGIPTCPANAHPTVKETSVYVSPYEYTRGVRDILEHFVPQAGGLDAPGCDR